MPYEELKKKLPEEGFKCKKLCGRCCVSGAPVGESEAREITDWLVEHVTVEELTNQFQHHDTDPAACPFLKPDKGCFIYPVRPVVCRMFGHMEDIPGAPAKWSQKCPEGVQFTEIKYADVAEGTLEWFAEIDQRSARTMAFRFMECVREDGTGGQIPVTPGSAMERLKNADACFQCKKPFEKGEKAYLEGAEILCEMCEKKGPAYGAQNNQVHGSGAAVRVPQDPGQGQV